MMQGMNARFSFSFLCNEIAWYPTFHFVKEKKKKKEYTILKLLLQLTYCLILDHMVSDYETF